MYFQRIRYSTDPPQVGQYETYGELTRGYPLPTAPYSFYEVWVWPEDAGPISTLTVPLLAMRIEGIWILMVASKLDASLLDPDAPVSGCNFG